jgi:hypothetical protein
VTSRRQPTPRLDLDLPDPLDGFDRWWSSYPRKEGKSKAREHWATMRPDERERCVDTQAAWNRYWTQSRTELRFVPHGSTWLSQNRWEDDPPEGEAPTKTNTVLRNLADRHAQAIAAERHPSATAVEVDQARAIGSGR